MPKYTSFQPSFSFIFVYYHDLSKCKHVQNIGLPYNKYASLNSISLCILCCKNGSTGCIFLTSLGSNLWTRTVRSTIGDRTFPATAASVWNSLSESVQSSPSLQVFRSRLKTELFAQSYSHV